MKVTWTLSIALAAMLLTGCETLNYSQYKISGPVNNLGARLTVSTTDQQAVKEIVANVAAQFKLHDMTSSSVVPGTLAYYTQIDIVDPMQIKLYTSADRIFVDVMQNSADGETLAFRKLKETIYRDLDEKFQDRLAITPAKTLEQKKAKPAQ